MKWRHSRTAALPSKPLSGLTTAGSLPLGAYFFLNRKHRSCNLKSRTERGSRKITCNFSSAGLLHVNMQLNWAWMYHSKFVFVLWIAAPSLTSSTGQKGAESTNKQMRKHCSWSRVLAVGGWKLEVQAWLLNDWSDYWSGRGGLAAFWRMTIQLLYWGVRVIDWLWEQALMASSAPGRATEKCTHTRKHLHLQTQTCVHAHTTVIMIPQSHSVM